MFLFKKIVAPFFSPLPVSLEILAIGLFLLWFTRKQWAGKIFVSVGSILLALLSYGQVSGALLETLESRYPTSTSSGFGRSSFGSENIPIKWIVVLAGGARGDPSLPLHSRITEHSRDRLLEGIRLHHLLPGSKLALTGGAGVRSLPTAVIMSRIAQDLGVRKSEIVSEIESRDTKDHPRFVAPIVKNDPFILVTSAFHMPRAIQLFNAYGLYPIPAPAGHRAIAHGSLAPGAFFPGSSGLRLAELAVHEYLGILWAKFRGQI